MEAEIVYAEKNIESQWTLNIYENQEIVEIISTKLGRPYGVYYCNHELWDFKLCSIWRSLYFSLHLFS